MSNQMSCEIEMIESQINNVVINYNNKVIEYEYNLKMLGECNNNYTCYYNKYYECLENINSIKYSIDYNVHDMFDNMMLNSLLKEYNAELKSCIIFFKCPFCSIARANHWTRHDF